MCVYLRRPEDGYLQELETQLPLSLSDVGAGNQNPVL